MRNRRNRILACIMAAAVSCSTFAPAVIYAAPAEENSQTTSFEGTSSLVMTDYKVIKSSGESLTEIKKGDVISLEISFYNSGILTSQIKDAKSLSVRKLVGSFKGQGDVEVVLDSQGDAPLAFRTVIQNLVYSGDGKTLPLEVGYEGLGIANDKTELTVSECVEKQEEQPPAEPPKEEAEKPQPEPEEERTPGGYEGEPAPLNVPTDPATGTPIEGPVPNIIIKKYRYGDKPRVAAGSQFNLSFDFFNTSKKTNIENMTVTVEPGEGVVINSSGNTFYYESLGKQKQETAEIGLLVSPDVKTGAVVLDVNFKYEYVDSGKRTAVTVPGKISVPVYLQDRFTVSAPVVPETVNAGEEVSISLPYVNKGKGELANVEAVLDGKIESVSRQQNLGNFEAGKSGSIDFVVKPEKEGEASFVIKISYEDANQEVQTKEFPVKLKVNPAPPDFSDEEIPAEEETTGQNHMGMIAGGTGVLMAAAAAAAVIMKRKSKKNKGEEDTFTWDDEEEEK